MLLQPREFPKLDTSAALREGSYSLMEGPVLFDMLSNKLYVHKEKASIREICTNAADANRDAGNGKKPIIIHAPSEDEPYFSVTDMGNGLDGDELLGTFTAFGYSTKRANAEANGTLGLGCKSPMAYLQTFSKTPSFTVISVKNERRYLANYAINSHGIPTPYLLEDEPAPGVQSGLTVTFECNPKELKRFCQAMEDVLQWFDAPYKIVGKGHACKVPSREILTKFGPLVVLKNEFSNRFDGTGFYVVMANVAYPVSLNALPDKLAMRLSFLQGKTRAYIEVPNGAVDFSISREGLEYNPHTLKALERASREIQQAFAKRIECYTDEGVFSSGNFFEDLQWLQILFTDGRRSLETSILHDAPKRKGDAYKYVVSTVWEQYHNLLDVSDKSKDLTLPTGFWFTMYAASLSGIESMSEGLKYVRTRALKNGGKLRVVFLDGTPPTRVRPVTDKLYQSDEIKNGDVLLTLGAPKGKVTDDACLEAAKDYFRRLFTEHPMLGDMKLELLSEVAPNLVPVVAEAKTTPIAAPSAVYDSMTQSFVHKKYFALNETSNVTHLAAASGMGRIRQMNDAEAAHSRYCLAYPEEAGRIDQLVTQLRLLGEKVGDVLVFSETQGTVSGAYSEGLRTLVDDGKKLQDKPTLTQALGAAAWRNISKKFSARAIVYACLRAENVEFESDVIPLKKKLASMIPYPNTTFKYLSEYLALLAGDNTLPAELASTSEDSSFAFFARGVRNCPEAAAEAEELLKWLKPMNDALAPYHIKVTTFGAVTGERLHSRGHRSSLTCDTAELAQLLMPGASTAIPFLVRVHQASLATELREIAPSKLHKDEQHPMDEVLLGFQAMLSLAYNAETAKKPRVWMDLDAIHRLLQTQTRTIALSKYEQSMR